MSADPEYQKEPKIYDYTDSRRDHRLINYKTELFQSLYPKRVMVQGELQQVCWYSDEARTDLVIRVDIVYARDAMGFAQHRTTTRTWICRDGTDHPDVKVTDKDYTANLTDQTREGYRRRGNVVDELQLVAMGLMMEALLPQGKTPDEVIEMGRLFLKNHQGSFKAFVEFSRRDVFYEIQEAADYWLLETPASIGGLTIRDVCLAKINIWGL